MKFKIEIVGNDIYFPINEYSVICMERDQAEELAKEILEVIANENSNQEDN